MWSTFLLFRTGLRAFSLLFGSEPGGSGRVSENFDKDWVGSQRAVSHLHLIGTRLCVAVPVLDLPLEPNRAVNGEATRNQCRAGTVAQYPYPPCARELGVDVGPTHHLAHETDGKWV